MKKGIMVLAVFLLIDVVLIDQWMVNIISNKTVIGLACYLILSAFLAVDVARLKAKRRENQESVSLTHEQAIIYEQLLQSLQLCLLNLVVMKGLVSYFENSSYFETPLRIDVILFFFAMSFIGHPLLTLISKAKPSPLKGRFILKMTGVVVVIAGYLFYSDKLQMSVFFFNQPLSGLLMLVTFLLYRYLFKLLKST